MESIVRRPFLACAAILSALFSAAAHAQLSQNMQDWMRRIDSGEFSGGWVLGLAFDEIQDAAENLLGVGACIFAGVIAIVLDDDLVSF